MHPVRRHWPHRIAHRGGGVLAPENTLAAIVAGIAQGYRAVEFDVMLTADDVPVLMHDPMFGRTVAGAGSVADTTYADLAFRDAGGWFGARYGGEPVPRYEDVLAWCRAHRVWMNVEIKPAPGHDEKTGRVVAALTVALFAADEDDRPLFSSFSAAALEAARRAAPHIDRGLLVEAFTDETLARAEALDCVSVHADHVSLDASNIARAHAAGFGVMGYTVNDRERVVALERMGIDAIFTDRIDVIEPSRT